ncbi:cysteine hydrolase family protein [Candidatus Xianfuyuplasma coldseepsis]|uniref:nicotinamidase n=1 Tax=Candidatus Xianfuyuplasma coldseepsis TaxID=2782163 RepID=A0A7L7KPZ5_9MOLU|nr:cysteine hydrolase family protein [Xianfuyuplasma coldseepsis]QMS84645.1 cysteine hydrolase family protein [Xianfuyuplasma coldseepsis]
MNKCLIVVDYQNDFIDGALGFDGALNIKDAIINKITQVKQDGGDVIFTKDTHTEDYLDTEEGQHLPVIHCVEGTTGHALQEDVDALRENTDVEFIKYSFPSLELGNYLATKDYEVIELCGLVSNICVLSNAVIAKSALPNAHIVVDAQATASFDSNLHEQALNILEGIHVEVINR